MPRSFFIKLFVLQLFALGFAFTRHHQPIKHLGHGIGGSRRVTHIPNPPPPLRDGSLKLVNDAAHPFRPPSPQDMRGPCPGLNTLANHGYLPRSGVATPSQIVTAVMEGYNLANDFAKFLVYQTHLMDGNPTTNLLSIGKKTSMTGQDPPGEAFVGGLGQHGTFEGVSRVLNESSELIVFAGDASLTRIDAFFGDPTQLNEQAFQQFMSVAKQYGVNGTYDIHAAAELRHLRIKQSQDSNPQFNFTAPRILSAMSESVFLTIFFVDGRKNDGQLTIEAAKSFFEDSRMPDGFHRQPAPVGFPTVEPLVKEIYDIHPFTPGRNNGTLSFTPMPETPSLFDFCGIYEDIVRRVIKSQYPSPTGFLKQALEKNLDFFYSAVKGHNCTQVSPWE